MAASITLSNLALAADGKTLTATLGGGTAPYSVVNNNGITVKNSAGNLIYFLGAVSVSGTTITILLNALAGVGETVKLDISASSTLTDSASNTPVVVANAAVANNSSVVIKAENLVTDIGHFETNGSFVIFSWAGFPAFNFSTSLAFGSGNASSNNFPIEFVTDATDVAIQGYISGAFAVSVDGGAVVNISGTGANGYLSIASNLGAGKHLIRVNAPSSNGYINGFRLSGGTRSMYAVPTTKYTAAPNSIANSTLPAASPIATWGTKQSATASGTVTATTYAGLLGEMAFSGTQVELATVMAGGSFSSSVDGGFAGGLVVAGDNVVYGNYDYAPMHTPVANGNHTLSAFCHGLGINAAWNGFRVTKGATATSAVAVGATSIPINTLAFVAVGDWVRIDKFKNQEVRRVESIAGNTLTFNSALSKAHDAGVYVVSYSAPVGTITQFQTKDLSAKRMVAMGDSNTHGFNSMGFAGTPDVNGVYYAPYDNRVSYANKLAALMSVEIVNIGIQGTDTINQAGRKADINLFSRNSFDYLLLLEGTNDINSNTVTPAQFKTNVMAQMDVAIPNLRAGGKIVLIPPKTPSSGVSGKGLSIGVCATMLQEIAADPTYSGKTIYAASAWDGVNLTTYNASTNPSGEIDGSLHFMPSAHDKVAVNLKNLLSGFVPALFPRRRVQSRSALAGVR